MKASRDPTPYPKDPRSEALSKNTLDGLYVYVQDSQGIVHVLPDGPHMHPKILGAGQSAMYAGDMTIENGRVTDLTNLSGTFQFEDETGIRNVARQVRQQGVDIETGAVRFFPGDGSGPVVIE